MNERTRKIGKNILIVLLVVISGVLYIFSPPVRPMFQPPDPDFSVGYTHIYFYDYNSTLEQGQYVYLEGNFTLVDQGNATIGVFHTNQTIILNESSFMYVHPIVNFSLFYANGFQIWGNGFMDTTPIIIQIPLNCTIL